MLCALRRAHIGCLEDGRIGGKSDWRDWKDEEAKRFREVKRA